MSSFSMFNCKVVICGLSCEPSLVVTEQATTGRSRPQARPRAAADDTNTYGTFYMEIRKGEATLETHSTWE